MNPQDFAKLAGITTSPKAITPKITATTVEAPGMPEMPDMARQMAMLAGVVPPRGQSALANDILVADSGIDPSLAGPASPPSESFLSTMSRASGIDLFSLEDGAQLPLDAIPPPVFAAPVGLPIVDETPMASPNRPAEAVSTMVVRTEVPAWAWQLRDAVESLLEKTIEPKDALKKMKDALEASKATPRSTSEPVAPPAVVETAEELQWKSYFNSALGD